MMKYLFVVNSNITALSAKAVIAYEKLPMEDIFVLTMRGAKIEGLDLKQVNFIYPHIINPIPQTRNILRCWKVLKEFDKFVYEITDGDKFRCYVNHNMARNVELLVNHPQCVGFSILEEGASAYNSKDYFERKYSRKFPSMWDFIGYKNRIRRRYFHRPDYDKVYAVTSGAFPGYKDKVVLKDVFLSGNSSYKTFDNSNIIVFDAAVTFEMIDLASFIEGLKKVISIAFNTRNQLIYYKFHPAQPNEERESIRRLFLNYPENKFVQLGDEIVLEELLFVASNLSLYFNISAVSIYANAFKHKCFSFSDILCSLSMPYKDKIKNLNETLRASSLQL